MVYSRGNSSPPPPKKGKLASYGVFGYNYSSGMVWQCAAGAAGYSSAASKVQGSGTLRVLGTADLLKVDRAANGSC